MSIDVLVVGAGPAGLAAAIELRRLGAWRVLVAEREQQPGGTPRHSHHAGYGVRDLHRMLAGPAYARHYARAASEAGAELRCGATVTALDGVRATLTSATGIETLAARAVLLATGCRERPRHARLVPGDRPSGIMTTGELQQRVNLNGQRLPGPALIVGAEHVSFSAVLTLARAGADVRALITDLPEHQSYAVFRLAARLRWGVPVWTSTSVRNIVGRGRLACVELADLRSGVTRRVACDTLVFTGDWIADHELARLAGAAMDARTKAPAVDTALRTSVPWLFAAGNLVHAAESADVAALGGRHAARQIATALRSGAGLPAAGSPSRPAVLTRGDDPPSPPAVLTRGDDPPNTPAVWQGAIPIETEQPLAWIAPGRIGVGQTMPARGRFVLRSTGARQAARLEVRQDGRLLARERARLTPGRSITLRADWVARLDPAGGPVRVTAR